MDDKQKHLEFIQGVINRLAGNSFLLKGWTVTLVSALFVLAQKNAIKPYIILTYIPVIMFWLLDGYFLRQERLYRKLYDEVRKKNDGICNYSMDTRPHETQVASWLGVMFSKTLVIFYGTLLVAVVAATYLLFYVSR